MDKKIFLGIGIGLIIGVTCMLGYKYKNNLSDGQIEERARALGMHYDSECKVIFKGEDEKND